MRLTKRRSATNGFSLIELLVVMAIIGILAALIVPPVKNSLMKANEAAAVTTLNTVKVAEAKYMIAHRGEYGTFAQLYAEGLLDKRFNVVEPVIRGYVFKLQLVQIDQKAAATFQLNANPEVASGLAATGSVFYFAEPDSGITYNNTVPASAADELL